MNTSGVSRDCVGVDPSARDVRIEEPKAPSRVGSKEDCPVPRQLKSPEDRRELPQ